MSITALHIARRSYRPLRISPHVNPKFFSSQSEILPPVLEKPITITTTNVPSKKTFFERVVDRFSPIAQRDRAVRAERYFQAATRQAADPRWFGPGRIGREFRARHALLTMHVWFLHKRLISDADDKEAALMVQEDLFNILWEDTICRIRQQGVNELLVNKSLLQVQQYTFLHLTHYDHAFTEFLDKPAERMKELRGIVWHHILVRDPDAEERNDQLNRIAWYIEANYQNVMLHWPDNHYREGRVAWVDLPDFSNMRDSDGSLMPENPNNPDDVLPLPWQRNITVQGEDYYWNPITMQSQWERPLS